MKLSFGYVTQHSGAFCGPCHPKQGGQLAELMPTAHFVITLHGVCCVPTPRVVNPKGVKLRTGPALSTPEAGRLECGQLCRVRQQTTIPAAAGRQPSVRRLEVVWPVRGWCSERFRGRSMLRPVAAP